MTLIRSIKHQVILSLVGLAVGLTLLFSAIALITAFAVEDALLYRLLDQRASDIERQLAMNTKAPVLPSNMIFYPSLQAVPADIQPRLLRPQMAGEIFTADGTHYHYRKINRASGEGYLLAEVSNLLVVSHQPGLFLLCGAGLILALIGAVWIALWLSRRIVHPVLRLTEAVREAESPNANIDMPELPHELGYLARRLQQSFTALRQTLEKEKAFANNVSHELRTPLAVVNNACALIRQRGYTEADLETLTQACRKMQHTVDALLALARAENAATQPCNLRMHLEQALLSEELAIPEHWRLSLDVPDILNIKANPRLLDILLFNLISNALEHSSEPALSIYYRDQQLTFSNTGTVADTEVLTLPGVRNNTSAGIGQGLYLVARIAEYFGWMLKISNTDKQFRVSLILL